jgi:ubiquinone biosynthesis monooxygenase Coq6
MNKLLKINFSKSKHLLVNTTLYNNKSTTLKYFSTSLDNSENSEKEIIDTDVLIVGGGVTGLSLASALLKSEFFHNSGNGPKITLIDQPMKIKPENFIYKAGRLPDVRCISLTPASIKFFRSIGMWNKLDERLVKFIKSMQIWENKGYSYINMDTNDLSSLQKFLNTLSFNNSLFTAPNVSKEYLCALVEINHLINGFNKLLSSEHSNNFKTYEQNLEYDNISIENTEDYAHLRLLKENKHFRAKLLVASDGAKSIIRNKLNIPTSGYDYNETGLVCTLRANRGSDVAYQRFLHNGIFALLPLYDDLYSIVCSMPKNVNENLKSLDEKTFIDVVNKILHNPSESDLLSNKLDRLIPVNNNFNSPPVITEILSKRFEFNLQLQYANENVYKNTVLIGDAAHVVHPMAGQGLNLGIADSAMLANEIVTALQQGRRLNDKRTLDSFSWNSQLNTKMMIGTIEGLKTFFTPTNYPVAEIRNFGLSFCNKSSYLKGLFMAAASGEAAQPKSFAWDKI